MLDNALRFLKAHNEVAFATSEGDFLKLRILQVMRQEGHVLYFSIPADGSVCHELQNNPNVEILSCADNVSVRCSGMVNFNVEDSMKRWIYDNNSVLSRQYASYDKLEYFCLPIAEVDFCDRSCTPPSLLHFDLITGSYCRDAMQKMIFY